MQHQTRTLAVCLLLVALALSGCFGEDASPTPTPRPFALPTLAPSGLPTTYPVARGNVVDELRFVGNVDLANEEEIYFGADGRLTELTVEHGDTVEAGQLLAKLDARSQEYDVDDATLGLAQAESRLAKQQKDLAANQLRLEVALEREKLRLAQLQDSGAATTAEITIQEINVRLAEFELTQLTDTLGQDLAIELARAQLRLQRATVALSETQALAPTAGQVLLLEGAKVNAQVAAYEPIAIVVDPGSVLVTASLPPEEMRSLQEGMPVTLELSDSSARIRIAAILVRLPAPYGSGRTLVEVAPETTEEGELLQPGSTVQVIAERKRATNVLWVPPSALQGFRDAYFVRLADGTEVPVTIGLQNNERVEILTGLTEGQTVLGR